VKITQWGNGLSVAVLGDLMWQRIDIHVYLRPSMSADLRNIKEKEQDFTTLDIIESDRTKPFLILYLCQHICLT
jgi:hypothetical protein